MPISRVMKMLLKIEDLLNRGLFWLGGLFVKVWQKVCPAPVRNLLAKFFLLGEFCKALPSKALQFFKSAPKELLAVNYKGIFASSMDAAREVYKKHQSQSPLKALLSAALAPFHYLYQWTTTLSFGQFFLLGSFSVASVFAIFGIAYTTHGLLKDKTGRAPASVITDEYERPVYYKQQTREVSLNNIKVPVYVEGVTELRALIVDFSAVASNRTTRQWIERHEFQVRDHLTMTIEPVLPAFPLTDEGRTMLADKVRTELNNFLAMNKVEGEVGEVRIIYALAH